MRIIDLNEENISLFRDFLGEDLAENIERTFFRGIVVENEKEEALAGMMWELRSREAAEGLESHIIWIRAEDEEAGGELLLSYRERASKEGAVRSTAAVYTKKKSLEIQLLKKYGFPMKLTEGDHITVPLSELSRMPAMKGKTSPDKVKPFSAVSYRSYTDFVSRLIRVGKTGLCEDIGYLSMSWFEPQVSCFCEEDGRVNGAILFHKAPSGCLEIKLLFVFGDDAKERGTQLSLMMKQAVAAMERYYPPETRVIVERHNEASLLLSEKLFPRGFGRPVYVGERREEPAAGKGELDDLDRFLIF